MDTSQTISKKKLRLIKVGEAANAQAFIRPVTELIQIPIKPQHKYKDLFKMLVAAEGKESFQNAAQDFISVNQDIENEPVLDYQPEDGIAYFAVFDLYNVESNG